MPLRNVQSESRASNTCYRVVQNCLLNAMNSHNMNQTYSCISGIVFVAFTFEAMVNHYGYELFTDWNNIERKYNRHRRLKKILEKIDFLEFLDSDEYLEIQESIQYRDRIVHGKTIDENFVMNVSGSKPKEKILNVVNHPSTLEMDATIVKLQNLLELLGKIENMIEDKLVRNIYPLSVTGLREW